MAQLPGWSLMLVGVAVMGYSKLIEANSDSNLAIFWWTGVLFLLWGLGREASGRLRTSPPVKEKVGPPPAPQKVQHVQHHPASPVYGQSPHQQHVHTKPVQHPSHPHTPTLRVCPSCHAANASQARRCHTCGFQFS